MFLGDTSCVYAHQSNVCPPFRLTYDYSVSPVVGSIALERALSLIPPLRKPYHCHLQPYHLLRRHPPNHQPPCQAPGNGFRSCVSCSQLPKSFCTNRACKPCCLKVYESCSGVRGHRTPIDAQPQRTPSIIPPPSQPMSTSSPPSIDWL